MNALQYSGVVGAGKGWTTVRTPDGGTYTVSGTRSTRNNNPGNIEYGAFARAQGAIGTDGRFAVFPSREVGFKAMQSLVFGGKYADLSLRQAIERYAPAFENNPAAYAAAVAKKAGVALTTKMKDIPEEVRSLVAQAMAGVEGLGKAVVTDMAGNIVGRIAPGQAVASLPDAMQAPPSKYSEVPSVPVAPTPQSIQTAMRLANIDNAQYAAPLGAIGRAPLGSIPSVPSRPTSPTPPSALASWDAPKPSPSFGLGLVTPAAASTLSPQDMRAAVNLGALPAGGTIPGMTTPLGQPPSFASPMMMAAAPTAPTQTFSPPSVPAMPSRPVTPTPPAALAAMNAPAVPSSLMAPAALGPLASLAPPDAVQPTFTPAVPEAIAPAVPSVPTAISPPGARQSVPASRPSVPSMASAADVYGGRANIGMATDGNIVSRDALGRMSVTNKYGATTTTMPGGWDSVSYGKAPSVPSAAPSVPGIAGPLSQGSIPSTPSTGLFGISPAKTETGNLARGLTGAMAGSALGSLVGPVGSLIGAALGKSIAQGKNPFDALTGNKVSFNTPAFGVINAAAPVSGLGFPGAPSMAGALGGTQSNRSMEGMRGISPGAASAIGRGVGGLY